MPSRVAPTRGAPPAAARQLHLLTYTQHLSRSRHTRCHAGAHHIAAVQPHGRRRGVQSEDHVAQEVLRAAQHGGGQAGATGEHKSHSQAKAKGTLGPHGNRVDLPCSSDTESHALKGRAARARRLFPKTHMMVLRLPLPHERFISSLVFATVAHSALISSALVCEHANAHWKRWLSSSRVSSSAFFQFTCSSFLFKITAGPCPTRTVTQRRAVVRSNAPEIYSRPQQQLQVDVLIIMQQQKDWPADLHACKDKFLVQSLVLDPNQVASIGASSPRL